MCPWFSALSDYESSSAQPLDDFTYQQYVDMIDNQYHVNYQVFAELYKNLKDGMTPYKVYTLFTTLYQNNEFEINTSEIEQLSNEQYHEYFDDLIHKRIYMIRSYEEILIIENIMNIQWMHSIFRSAGDYDYSNNNNHDDQVVPYVELLLKNKDQNTVQIFKHFYNVYRSVPNLPFEVDRDILRCALLYADDDVLDFLKEELMDEEIVSFLIHYGKIVYENVFTSVLEDEHRIMISEWVMNNKNTDEIEEFKQIFINEWYFSFDQEVPSMDEFINSNQYHLMAEKYRFLQ
jgi:hypothetical protein